MTIAQQARRKGARSETARHINRSLVLTAIRLHQPLSRADLARKTGLQRSTISLIADQLLSDGWVVDGAVAQLPRGRKPTLLSLNTGRVAIIGINVMPETTVIALGDLNMDFKAREAITTDSNPSVFIDQLIERVLGLMKAHPGIAYEGIGISLPGRIDDRAQRLVFAPNLGWRNIDIKTPLEQATGLPVQIENAANACALSEVWSGPHEGVRDLIAVTVSEGIGTGIIANGLLVRGPSGAAGEFGHICLNSEGPPCRCGSRGCWEVYASNAAAIRNYNQGTSRGRKSKAQASVSSFGDLVLLAQRGDVTAGQVIDDMAYYLGLGLATLVSGLAPSVITIVGEVTRLWDRVGPIVDRVVSGHAHTHAETKIVPSDATQQPRLKGTIALVLQKHFQPQLLT